MGLRGGPERTRTSNQAVIAKRWAKQGVAILPTSTIASRKRRSPQYLSGKLSGGYLGDQLSIGRSGRICGCLFETLKSLTFSNAGFDFVYSPCVLVSRRLQPLRTATWDRTQGRRTDPRPRRAIPELPRAAGLRFSARHAGSRRSTQMASNVTKLTLDDMMARAAYAASLPP
jgi:hypothetical protein